MQLFGPDSLAIAPELPVRVGAAAERLTVTAVAPEPSRETRDFARRFQARYGSEPHARAILGYDAMQLVLQAIDAAGADAGSRPAVIREALRAGRAAPWRVRRVPRRGSTFGTRRSIPIGCARFWS